MVYCSESLSLAVLESFVNFDAIDLPDDYVSLVIEIPDEVAVEELDPSRLPASWRDHPGPDELRALGSAWCASATAAVLSVPSAVIERERNYLLNPDHPDFAKLAIVESAPFRFDPRMAKQSPLAPTVAPRRRKATPKPKRKPAPKKRASGKRRP